MPAPAGVFPKWVPATHPQTKARESSRRISLELERIWRLQQQLSLPQGKLSELVQAALQTIRAPAKRVGMLMWVDMLLAIQQGLDHRIEEARATACEMGLAPPSVDDRAHRMTAQVIAYFYIGLLEVSPLKQAIPPGQSDAISITRHLERHRLAQCLTKEALGHLHQSGLKPPEEFASLVSLINVLVNALNDMPDPPGGLLHMIIPATMDAPHSCECLYAYALTQLHKGRLDRAALVLDVCRHNTLRRGQRLLAALLLTDLHHARTALNEGVVPTDLAEEYQLILKCWLGHSKEDANEAVEGLLAMRRADRIQRALAFIGTHIDTKFTTHELANVCGVSARTIAEDFRAVFHKTVLAYVTEERMRVALGLLQDRSLPLEAVSAKVGFQSPFGFTKAFLRTYGHMPVRPMSNA
jgi:AraC-like DNA-binding protein